MFPTLNSHPYREILEKKLPLLKASSITVSAEEHSASTSHAVSMAIPLSHDFSSFLNLSHIFFLKKTFLT